MTARRTLAPLALCVATVLLALGAPGVAAATAPAKKPPPLVVLVTNDDGVGAPGIDELVRSLRALRNVKVTVVAPLEDRTGTGDRTTPGELVVSRTTTESGIKARAVDGYPADTVNWSLDHGIRPDVVVSGINKGQNLGPVVGISGTVGAAKAAVRRGVPALAVSQGIADTPDYQSGAELAVDWVQQHRRNLAGKKPAVELANLNVPTCLTARVRGVKEVPAAATGDPAPAVDCASTLTDPVDDVQAFANGFASLSVIDAG